MVKNSNCSSQKTRGRPPKNGVKHKSTVNNLTNEMPTKISNFFSEYLKFPKLASSKSNHEIITQFNQAKETKNKVDSVPSTSLTNQLPIEEETTTPNPKIISIKNDRSTTAQSKQIKGINNNLNLISNKGLVTQLMSDEEVLTVGPESSMTAVSIDNHNQIGKVQVRRSSRIKEKSKERKRRREEKCERRRLKKLEAELSKTREGVMESKIPNVANKLLSVNTEESRNIIESKINLNDNALESKRAKVGSKLLAVVIDNRAKLAELKNKNSSATRNINKARLAIKTGKPRRKAPESTYIPPGNCFGSGQVSESEQASPIPGIRTSSFSMNPYINTMNINQNESIEQVRMEVEQNSNASINFDQFNNNPNSSLNVVDTIYDMSSVINSVEKKSEEIYETKVQEEKEKEEKETIEECEKIEEESEEEAEKGCDLLLKNRKLAKSNSFTDTNISPIGSNSHINTSSPKPPQFQLSSNEATNEYVSDDNSYVAGKYLECDPMDTNNIEPNSDDFFSIPEEFMEDNKQVSEEPEDPNVPSPKLHMFSFQKNKSQASTDQECESINTTPSPKPKSTRPRLFTFQGDNFGQYRVIKSTQQRYNEDQESFEGRRKARKSNNTVLNQFNDSDTLFNHLRGEILRINGQIESTFKDIDIESITSNEIYNMHQYYQFLIKQRKEIEKLMINIVSNRLPAKKKEQYSTSAHFKALNNKATTKSAVLNNIPSNSRYVLPPKTQRDPFSSYDNLLRVDPVVKYLTNERKRLDELIHKHNEQYIINQASDQPQKKKKKRINECDIAEYTNCHNHQVSSVNARNQNIFSNEQRYYSKGDNHSQSNFRQFEYLQPLLGTDRAQNPTYEYGRITQQLGDSSNCSPEHVSFHINKTNHTNRTKPYTGYKIGSTNEDYSTNSISHHQYDCFSHQNLISPSGKVDIKAQQHQFAFEYNGHIPSTPEYQPISEYNQYTPTNFNNKQKITAAIDSGSKFDTIDQDTINKERINRIADKVLENSAISSEEIEEIESWLRSEDVETYIDYINSDVTFDYFTGNIEN
ncbi:hypothetical protein K502DRAFT_330145 [Neoconidiobolus thromboides FSU 785]|nr:hypothetical protein K502DRAFT_330145 [Neoconidiobolus thromboides FSU 785]